MFEAIVRTGDTTAAPVLRLVLGIVFFAHGAQKLLGWFGGFGFSGTMGYFTDTVGIPGILAFLVIMAEFFGSLGVLVGLLTRIAAAAIGCVMLGAIFTVHLPNGFFMDWQNTGSGQGYEYHLLALGIVVALVIMGGGRASLDRMITRRRSA